jgi:hypothetical protein
MEEPDEAFKRNQPKPIRERLTLAKMGAQRRTMLWQGKGVALPQQ